MWTQHKSHGELGTGLFSQAGRAVNFMDFTCVESLAGMCSDVLLSTIDPSSELQWYSNQMKQPYRRKGSRFIFLIELWRCYL